MDIWNYIDIKGIITGLAVVAIAGIFTWIFFRKKLKSNSQKISQFGWNNKAENNITDTENKK